MSVTLEQARTAVMTKVAALAATWTAYTLVIEYDNRNNVNYGTQTLPFLDVELFHISGEQASLGETPTHRLRGSIILTARVKVGQGMSTANTLLEHFYPSMQMTDTMSPVRTYAARIVTAAPKEGWAGISAVIPYWYDS